MTVRSALRAPVRAAVRAPIILRKRWTPAALFAEGQQGVWYEPKPQYLYQDSAGTTPVTADGDPVGLMLDLSRGGNPTEEIQPNSNFDADLSGWTSSYWQWDAGAAYHPPGGDFNTLLSVDISAYRGKWIYLEFSVLVLAGEMRCQYRTSTDSPTSTGQESYPGGGQNGFSSGTYRLLSRVPSNATYIGFARDVPDQITEIRLESSSIKELPGNHATQATSAARPVNSDTPPLQVYDNVDDAMSVTLPAIAAATVAIATPTGADIQYPVDLSSGSYTITESHSGIIIREGELTADEHQRVTSYLNAQAGV